MNESNGPPRSPTSKPTGGNLPYDPEAWEERLAVARAKRAIVQRERAEARKLAGAADGSEGTIPGGRGADAEGELGQGPFALGEMGLLSGPRYAAERPVPASPAASSASASPSAASPPARAAAKTGAPAGGKAGAKAPIRAPRKVTPPPRIDAQPVGAVEGSMAWAAQTLPSWSSARQLKPVLFGLAVGCVLGGSLVGFFWMAPNLAELKTQVTTFVPAVTVSETDAPVPPMSDMFYATVTAPEPAVATLVEPEKRVAVVGADLEVAEAAEVEATVVAVSNGSGTPANEGVSGAGDAYASGEDGVFGVLAPVPWPGGVPAAIADEGAAAGPRPERVVVQMPREMAAPQREALQARLAEGGWSMEPSTSPFTISDTHVRYYHAEDRVAAEALAAQFEAGARDFTNHRPSPNPGLLEVWLSGTGTGRRASAQVSTGRVDPTRIARQVGHIIRTIVD